MHLDDRAWLDGNGDRLSCSWQVEDVVHGGYRSCARQAEEPTVRRPPIPLCYMHEPRLSDWYQHDALVGPMGAIHPYARRADPPGPGFVYFVRRKDGLVKIGFSKSPIRRIATLMDEFGPLSVLVVIRGSRSMEYRFHGQFAQYWSDKGPGREWFRYGPKLKAFVKELQAAEKVAA